MGSRHDGSSGRSRDDGSSDRSRHDSSSRSRNHGSSSRSRRRRKQRRRRIGWSVFGVTLALVALAVLMASQSLSAYRHLDKASRVIPTLRQQLTEGDTAGAQRSAEQFRKDAEAARDAVHGPHWWLLAQFRWVGPNVSAVRTVTDTLDEIASKAMPDLIDAAEVLGPEELTPDNGRINLEPIRQAAPPLFEAAKVVGAAEERLSAVDTSQLSDLIEEPVSTYVDKVQEMSYLTGAASTASRLMPRMLGSERPRHYLLLVQNNAEPRALGGINGSLILIRAQNGKITRLSDRPATGFGSFERPVVDLTPAEQALFGPPLGRFVANATATPHFPRSAEIAREMWRKRTGRTLDGVAAVDPYGLQLVLGATGPITMPNGQQLNGQNAAQILLNGIYLTIPDTTAQDEFFSDAAAEVFDLYNAGAGDVTAGIRALDTSARQGRLMLWSSRPREQSLITGTALSGELRGSDDGSPQIGVYLHDRTPGKMGYYQRVRARVVSCSTDDDSSDLRLQVRVASTAPKNAATLPDAVTGGGQNIPRGRVRTEVYVYAPEGGIVTGTGRDSGPMPVRSQIHDGLNVVSHAVTLAPGGSTTLKYDMSVPPTRNDVRLRITPGAVSDQFATQSAGCRPGA
jgi:hypothetical protein